MRAFLVTLALGAMSAALLPASSARAWYDGYGRWHPDYYRPPVVYAPPPPPPYYAQPYGRWIPNHYDRFGRFVPGHWE